MAAQEQEVANRLAQAQTPEEQEIEIASAPIRKQRANMEAEQREMAQDEIGKAKAQEYKTSRLQQIDNKIKAINQMNVDPDRYWNNKPTGQKIVAALAMALGAYTQTRNNR
jgi:multidrug resistance efflux pump